MTDNSVIDAGPASRDLSRKVFVNLPVRDLARSVAFFTGLGFTFDEQFTDERAAAMVVNDGAFVMLLVEDFFSTFTGQPVPATREAVIAVSARSREEVDDLVGRALGSGGARAQEPMADGPMYGWSFLDPDGHQWELIHMDLRD